MSVEQLPARRERRPKDDTKLVGYDEYIDTQIRSTRRAVKMVDLATSLIVLAAGVLAFLLTAAVVENWVMPGGFSFIERVVLFSVLVAGVSYFAFRRLWPLVARAINPVYAAQAIEQSSPTLKNSLVNLLLFRQRRSDISDAVYHTLEEQAAQRLTRVSLESAVDRTLLIRFGYMLIGIVAVAGLYKVLSPKDPLVAARRVLMPWARIVPASRVTITAIEPGMATVPRGESLDVSAEVRGLGENDAVQLRFTTEDGQFVDKAIPLKSTREGLRFTCRLPEESSAAGAAGLTRNLMYRIEAGDARSLDYKVTVVAAPSILVERVEYDYPAYTGYVDHEVAGRGDIRAIEGTKVTVHARANDPIRVAEVDFDADGRRDLNMTTNESEARASFDLALREDRKTPEHASYVLRFTNDDGRANRNPVKHSIVVEPDLAPEATIRFPQEKILDVRLDEPVTIEVEAGDPDFGLSSVRLKGNVGDRAVLDEPLLESKHTGRFTGKFAFSANARNLKTGDVVQYWAEASDVRAPKAHVTKSEAKALRIISPNPAQQPPPDQLARNDRQRQQDQQQRGGQQRGQDQQGQGQDQQGQGQEQQGQQGQGQQEEGKQGENQQGQQGQQEGQARNGDQQGKEDKERERGGDGETGRGGDKESGQQGDSSAANENGSRDERGQEQSSKDGGGKQGSQQNQDGSGEKSQSTGQSDGKGESDGEAGKDQQSRQGQQNSGQSKQGGQQDQQTGAGAAGGESSKGGAQPAGARPDDGKREGEKGRGGEGEKVQHQAEPDDQKSAVSSEGDNDADAFERIREHMKQKGDLKEEEGETGRGGDKENGEPGSKADKHGDDVAQQKKGQDQKPAEGKGPSGGETATKGESGAGQEQKPQGAPDSQSPMKPTEKREQAGSNKDQSDKTEPAAGAHGKKESDSQGEQGGDKAGGGEEGGGQKSPHDGTGSAGQNQSADKGAGESSEKGAGNNSQNAGQDAKSDRETGESDGETKGRGSKTREGAGPDDKETGSQGEGEGKQEGERGRGGDKESRGDKAQKKDGESAGDKGDSAKGKEPGEQRGSQRGEGGGKTPDEAIQPGQSGETAPEGDAANLEYARKQTDLVLDKLADQLNRKKVDQNLLKDLGWSEADMRKFIERWQARKEAAARDDASGDAARKELDDALRSLGLRRGPLQQSKVRDDTMRDLREGYRGPVPLEYQERLRAYNQGVSRARQDSK